MTWRFNFLFLVGYVHAVITSREDTVWPVNKCMLPTWSNSTRTPLPMTKPNLRKSCQLQKQYGKNVSLRIREIIPKLNTHQQGKMMPSRV